MRGPVDPLMPGRADHPTGDQAAPRRVCRADRLTTDQEAPLIGEPAGPATRDLAGLAIQGRAAMARGVQPFAAADPRSLVAQCASRSVRGRAMALRRAFLLALGLTLAGCNVPNDKICTTPPSLEKSLSMRDDGPRPDAVLLALRQGQFTRECVHRWAYRLAGSNDQAPTVARAAVAGCRDAKELWDARDYVASGNRTSEMLPSSRDGSPLSRPAAHSEELSDIALFSVVQARAGHCKAK